MRDPGRVDRLLLGRIWRSSALRLVSTPDLVDAVPRSQYLPNPVDTTAFRAAGAIVPDQDVFVFAALTDVKGGPRLVDAVRALRHIDPRVRVTAFAGDPYSERMGAAGATLIERVSPDDLPALVARHRVIIGQQRLGALGVSELQAMATGRPLVGHVRADLDYGTVDPPHAEAHEPESIAQATLTLLGDTAAATDVGEAGARWTVEHHDRRRVCRELLGRYSEVLGTDLLHHGEISP